MTGPQSGDWVKALVDARESPAIEGVLHLRHVPSLDYVQVNVVAAGRIHAVDPDSVEVLKPQYLSVEELEASDPLTDEPGWRRVVDLDVARVEGLVQAAVARQGGTWADLLATLTTLVSTLHEAGWQTVRQHSEESGEHGDSVLVDLERSGVSIEIEFYEHGTLVGYPLGREGEATDDATSEALFVLDDATMESCREMFAAQGWLEPPSSGLPRP